MFQYYTILIVVIILFWIHMYPFFRIFLLIYYGIWHNFKSPSWFWFILANVSSINFSSTHELGLRYCKCLFFILFFLNVNGYSWHTSCIYFCCTFWSLHYLLFKVISTWVNCVFANVLSFRWKKQKLHLQLACVTAVHSCYILGIQLLYT